MPYDQEENGGSPLLDVMIGHTVLQAQAGNPLHLQEMHDLMTKPHTSTSVSSRVGHDAAVMQTNIHRSPPPVFTKVGHGRLLRQLVEALQGCMDGLPTLVVLQDGVQFRSGGGMPLEHGNG